MCLHTKSLQLCPILCDPMGCSLQVSSVHGVLQARILEWIAVLSSRDQTPGILTQESNLRLLFPALKGGFFTISTTWEAPYVHTCKYILINNTSILYVCVYIIIIQYAVLHIYTYIMYVKIGSSLEYTLGNSYKPQSESKSERHSVLSDSLRPHGLCSPWNSLGQNTGGGSLSLLQGIFLTQGLNPGLSHCRRILYQLSHKGSPRTLGWVAYPFSRGSS